MQVIVKAPGTGTPIWDHFLMKGTEVTIKASDGPTTSESKMLKTAGAFRWDMPDTTVSIDLVLNVVFTYSGANYNLLKIVQRFDVEKQNNAVTALIPRRWQKIIPSQATGFAKVSPPLHPLLLRDKGTITAAIEFVDITQLFYDIHGDTPWYSALALLKGTSRTIRVLAALRGHPFIWYAVIPDSVAAKQNIQPNVLFYPYDYGGIFYAADRLEGITTQNHDTSIGSIQCGGETLFSFLTKPISDADHPDKLEQYLRLTERYKKRPGRNPPALHHFREVLAYNVSDGSLEPRYWDVPFGFEQGVYDRQQILLVLRVIQRIHRHIKICDTGPWCGGRGHGTTGMCGIEHRGARAVGGDCGRSQPAAQTRRASGHRARLG